MARVFISVAKTAAEAAGCHPSSCIRLHLGPYRAAARDGHIKNVDPLQINEKPT